MTTEPMTLVPSTLIYNKYTSPTTDPLLNDQTFSSFLNPFDHIRGSDCYIYELVDESVAPSVLVP